MYYIVLYTYREREREREGESGAVTCSGCGFCSHSVAMCVKP